MPTELGKTRQDHNLLHRMYGPKFLRNVTGTLGKKTSKGQIETFPGATIWECLHLSLLNLKKMEWETDSYPVQVLGEAALF